MAVELLRICHRESVGPGSGECRPVGVHAIDVWASPTAYQKAVDVGWLDPECQPYVPGEWSSRGSWGLLAAFQLKWVGVKCAQPWWLDIPLVSAWAAARKLRAHCETPPGSRDASTRRWGRCDWRVEGNSHAPAWLADVCVGARVRRPDGKLRRSPTCVAYTQKTRVETLAQPPKVWTRSGEHAAPDVHGSEDPPTSPPKSDPSVPPHVESVGTGDPGGDHGGGDHATGDSGTGPGGRASEAETEKDGGGVQWLRPSRVNPPSGR